MDDSRRKTLLITIFIFILITATAILYFTYTKDVKTVKSNNDSEINNKPTKKTDEELIIEKIKKYNLIALRYYKNDLSFKKSEVTEAISYSEPMGELLFAYVSDHGSLNREAADKLYKDLFGYAPETMIPYVCPLDNEELLSVDDAKELYYINENHPGHGGRIYDYIDLKIIDTKKTDNLYEVSVAFLYGNNADGFYINDKEIELPTSDEKEYTEEDYIKAYKDFFKEKTDFTDVEKYTYTFEKENNNYILKEFKRTI